MLLWTAQLETNDCPGTVTLQEKFKWPTRDRRSLFLHEVFFKKAWITSQVRVILSTGSQASILIVSRTIPKYSSSWAGPTDLWVASGIFSLLNMSDKGAIVRFAS